MAARLFGGLDNQIDQDVSLGGLQNRLAGERAIKRRDPDFASACLYREGGMSLWASAFHYEFSLCCHGASLPIPWGMSLKGFSTCAQVRLAKAMRWQPQPSCPIT
ncbi:MAG: hypothetical protein ACRDS9_14125, partial [Pseudonocardiaceae bacterium]